MTGDQWIALAGVASGALLGLGGLIFGYVSARAERDHSDRLARSERTHQQRVAAYTELSTFLERLRMLCENLRVNYLSGEETLPIPDGVDNEDWLRLRGQAMVTASDAAVGAVDAARTQAGEFVALLRAAERLQKEGVDPAEVREMAGRMFAARTKVDAAIDAAQAAMRDELSAL